MISIRLAIVCVLLLVTAACVSPGPSPLRGSHTPRARCLNDPNETGARPLFFLFCVETP